MIHTPETETALAGVDHWMKKWSCVPEVVVRRLAATLVPDKSWTNQKKYGIIRDFLTCAEGHINDCRFRTAMIEVTSFHKEAKLRLDREVDKLLEECKERQKRKPATV